MRIHACMNVTDEERSLHAYNAVWPWDAVSMTEVDSFKEQVLEFQDHVALAGEEVVGSGAVAISPRRPDVGFAMIAVLPAHRRQGAGTALYRTISAWLAKRGVTRIDAPVPEDDSESVAFAERRGFVEVERSSRMFLDLADSEPLPIDPPTGVVIVPWAERPELGPSIYQVACEAYPDVPGERDKVMEPYEDWLAHDMSGPGDRPDATMLALAEDEVVGYAKFSLNAAQLTVAFHDMTGVRRAWRGRGVAGALKRAQLAWARREGYARVVTQNEVRNEPIRRLNRRLGYKLAPGRVVMRGPIAEL